MGNLYRRAGVGRGRQGGCLFEAKHMDGVMVLSRRDIESSRSARGGGEMEGHRAERGEARRARMRETLRAARDRGSSRPLTELSRSRVSRGRTSAAKNMFLLANAPNSEREQQVSRLGAHADCRLGRAGVSAGAEVTSEGQARTFER